MNQYAETVEKNNGYLYILRRTVPPWRWRENLDELVRLCPKYGIDEVCIKIDTGTFTHYYPSFEWLENYRKILLQIKKELNEVGVNYSLNPNASHILMTSSVISLRNSSHCTRSGSGTPGAKIFSASSSRV